jgi:hypothetical protein
VDFDPSQPFAFHPPDYETLVGEPPKYDDIEMSGGELILGGGNSNQQLQRELQEDLAAADDGRDGRGGPGTVNHGYEGELSEDTRGPTTSLTAGNRRGGEGDRTAVGEVRREETITSLPECPPPSYDETMTVGVAELSPGDGVCTPSSTVVSSTVAAATYDDENDNDNAVVVVTCAASSIDRNQVSAASSSSSSNSNINTVRVGVTSSSHA